VGKNQYGGKRMRCPPKEENHENGKIPLNCRDEGGKNRLFFREEKNGYFILKFPMIMRPFENEYTG